MNLHGDLFSVPLKNPVLIFSVILFIILFVPILLDRIRIPQLIGLILAGAFIGPHGVSIMARDSSIILFGTVGLLYIMFLAGLEIDLGEFRRNSLRSAIFGLYTFLLPMTLGTLVFRYLLNYGWLSSILIASMFASHTLVTYPIISKLGVTKNRAVTVTIGGTLITDTLALLVLAAVVGLATGNEESTFWRNLVLGVTLFAVGVSIGFPLIGTWFFKRFDDSIAQFIFVLAMVFLASFLAEVAGMEAIIGAFLAGLTLNRLIPATSPLMNRIEFVGNALFIPFFLIGVGMLVDFTAFIRSPKTILVAVVMSVLATVAKYGAAWLTKVSFQYSNAERQLIFGLSNSQAAATLAVVLVGYNIGIGTDVDGNMIRLLDDSILNGTILMILVTCTIASFVTQKGAQALAEEAAPADPQKPNGAASFLIPVKNPENIEELVNLSLALGNKKEPDRYTALHVIEASSPEAEKEQHSRKLLDKAVHIASAADKKMTPVLRYDLNLVSGINSAVQENKVTDLILGAHRKKGLRDSFLGNLTEGILARCRVSIWVYCSRQPLATTRRYRVIMPEKIEFEAGFVAIADRLRALAENTGASLTVHCREKTAVRLKSLWKKQKFTAKFEPLIAYQDLIAAARLMVDNEGLILLMSRNEGMSYQPIMDKVPRFLNRIFADRNFILVYPEQELGVDRNFGLRNSRLVSAMDRLAKWGRGLFSSRHSLF